MGASQYCGAFFIPLMSFNVGLSYGEGIPF